MTESELRLLVRDAIARHAVRDVPTPAAVPGGGGGLLAHQHVSHGTFVLPVGSDGDGLCLIEPAVMCNHCGYCKSYGH
jgi:hypothetical protein